MAGKVGKTAQQGGKSSSKMASNKAGSSKAANSKAASGKDGGINRRRFDRRDTAIPAWLSHEGQRYDGHVTNLSLDGCLFNPAPDLPDGGKVKIWLSDRKTAISGKVVMRSARGLHCRLSVAAPTLARMSAELDDMALLLLGATRMALAEPPVKKAVKKAAKTTTKTTAKKNAVKKAAKKAVAKKKR